MENKRVRVAVILACFVTAAFFLFCRLGKGDPVTDEIELAFRAVGYMDFLATPFQTTPLEWFSEAPWWAGLSFHDHPPMIFALSHLVFKFFGDSLLALRAAFAVLGLGSLCLLYLFTKKILNPRVALIALAIGALSTYLTWIGRIGLQEELVIFFTLLCLYFLTLAERKTYYFFLWGLAFGLALLSKYTTAIILPISIMYLWYFNRPALKHKYFYLATAVSILIFSPILVYNLGMYNSVGHFDLQFSAFLGQDVSAHWQSLLGKQIGSLGDRVAGLYPNLWNNDLPLLLFFGPSFLFFLYALARKRLQPAGRFIFWILVLYHLLIIFVGPSQRFLVMLVPWAIIAVAYTLDFVLARSRAAFAILCAALLIYQAWYNTNTNLVYVTPGNSSFTSSKLYYESASFGYNELEQFLRETLDTKKPGVMLSLPSKLKFVESYREPDFRGTGNNPETRYLITYDPRLNQVAKLWLYDRRYYYDGWPFVSVDEYLQVQKVAPQYFQDLGITDYFYIATTPETFTGGYLIPETAAPGFEQQMFIDQAIRPEREITNQQDQKVFRIYHFSL